MLKMNYWPVIGLFALAACGQPRPVIIAPPAELATCADAPEAPELPAKDGTDAVQMVRDQMILTFILALRSAYGDCRAKVDGLAAWRAGVE